MEENNEIINPDLVIQPDYEDWLHEGCRRAEQIINNTESEE